MGEGNLTARYRVYRIRFAGGEVYVGHTRRPLAKRLAAHRLRAGGDNPINRRLADAFRREEAEGKARIEQVGLMHATHEAALEEEQEAITMARRAWGDQRVLNSDPAVAAVAQGERKSRYRAAKEEGLFRCSWCRRDLGPEMYWRDSCRWNGLMSRCKDCCRAYKSTGGRSAAECYRCVKEERREWGASASCAAS